MAKERETKLKMREGHREAGVCIGFILDRFRAVGSTSMLPNLWDALVHGMGMGTVHTMVRATAGVESVGMLFRVVHTLSISSTIQIYIYTLESLIYLTYVFIYVGT